MKGDVREISPASTHHVLVYAESSLRHDVPENFMRRGISRAIAIFIIQKSYPASVNTFCLCTRVLIQLTSEEVIKITQSEKVDV